MSWYTNARYVLALRKHNLRADLRVYGADENTDPSNQAEITGRVKGILSSAMLQGLDILGIVTTFGPIAGWIAQDIINKDQLDIWVIPGEEYLTSDKFRLLVYMLRDAVPPNMSYQEVVNWAHKNNGLVMVSELTRRQAQQINKTIGSPSAPDMVEIYNAATGAYQDIDVELPKFVSSASRNATDLENTNVFTLLPRKDAEGLGLLPENHGKGYKPGYLRDDSEEAAMTNIKNTVGKGAKRTELPAAGVQPVKAPSPFTTTQPVPNINQNGVN